MSLHGKRELQTTLLKKIIF